MQSSIEIIFFCNGVLLDAGEAAGRRLSFRAYQLLLPQVHK
jgi:hypothetical protein